MNFEPSAEQKRLQEAVRAFAATLNEGMIERDAAGEFSRDAWRRCAEFGIPGLPIPEEFGGTGQDLLTTIIAMEAMGYGCRDNGLVFSLNAQMWAFEMPLLHFGTQEQKRRWLPRVCAGELIGAHAVSEPDFGSDAMAMTTRYRRDGDHYVLDGAKTFVTNGPVADVVLAFATLDPKFRSAGITAFLIERGTPGLTISKPIPKMGLRTSPMGEVTFADCRVPVTSRLGGEGTGFAIFNSAMEWERACIFASHLGSMQHTYETCVAYAKSRKQFGEPIGHFAPVADKIVEMRVAIELGRLLLYKIGAVKDAGGSAVLESAMAKLFISEAHVQQALDAIQIHGGYGYSTEYEIERELRDAVPGRIYSGTSEIQRRIIARLLGLS
ncbi:MAG: acyl-CoA dehydrogenase family protein [Krumholzibacteria bacterium]|nr:acyl-CoA dehydrogenase family protein [Candidatus Krumholzibacteria bacterium]